MQETQVSNFKINKLTKAQYTGITPNQNEVYITTDEAGAVASVNSITPNASGNVTIKTSNITNDSGYITSSALSGYATETWVGNQGYITGITSGDVTAALGYTPADSSSIPTVNDGTLTITQSGSTLGTFTANQSGNTTIDIASGGSSRNIGEIVQSTIPLTDAGLHLLDGELLSGSGIYGDFVDYIADLYDSGNYDDIFDTEANWQSSVTSYGVCGKFVYDSNDNTVRLPKIEGFTEATINPTLLGDLTAAGLPNITGALHTYILSGASSGNYWTLPTGGHTGAFAPYTTSKVTRPYYTSAGTSTATWDYGSKFDASNSNSIYGNSATVQPQSIKVLYYIVVANTTKTAIEVDIDEIATDLNGKVDKAGDTMTGSLIVTHDNGDIPIYIKHNTMERGVNPASNLISYLRFCDKSGNSVGNLYSRQGTNGDTSMRIGATDGTNSAYLYMGVDSNGKGYCSFPRCTTAATTTSTASNSRYAVVVENYKSGKSWYRVWSDGWIEQGGWKDTSSTATDVALLKNFSDTNYSITFGGNYNGNAYCPCAHTITASSFKVYTATSNVDFYWMACGY